MITRLIVFDRDGNKVPHQLSLHHKMSNTCELKLVMDTSCEHFECWMFFFLRDHGAYIETTDPSAVVAALNLSPGEEGILKVEG
ncbi:MAG TPA: hypothetical protein VN281_22320 [Verrucomicrobiae bacterium]|jgi:hypothetical protein|nr:hypothetical protein [Verrucomicrobiae bacterium]